MKLRKLELKDASQMLEWMHDEDVIKNLQADFLSKTLKDCQEFIVSSWSSSDSCLHYAIADEEDVYQGTVSLKHINYNLNSAEFAIVIRKSAMGTGISKSAMESILHIGEAKGLKTIVWCVNNDNKRAIKFYDKNSYQRIVQVPDWLSSFYPENNNLIWYCWRSKT